MQHHAAPYPVWHAVPAMCGTAVDVLPAATNLCTTYLHTVNPSLDWRWDARPMVAAPLRAHTQKHTVVVMAIHAVIPWPGWSAQALDPWLGHQAYFTRLPCRRAGLRCAMALYARKVRPLPEKGTNFMHTQITDGRAAGQGRSDLSTARLVQPTAAKARPLRHRAGRQMWTDTLT